jgi:hypothetical protein
MLVVLVIVEVLCLSNLKSLHLMRKTESQWLHVLNYKFYISTTIKIDSGFKKYTLLLVWNVEIHQTTGE